MTFFRRRPVDADVERALRASLAARARQAPSGSGLPERILAAVDSGQPQPLEQPRRWVGWALPAIAAAATVAAVAVAVAVGVTIVGNSPQGQAPQANRPHQMPRRYAGSPTMPPAQGSQVSSGPSGSAGLQGVRIRDLTFAGTDDGWALATADCRSGQGRCTALLRTHDGTHWRPLSAPPFRFPTVSHIRFATDRVGYAFGPSAFYLTSDGGHTWQRQPGGAIALETLNGNVIRVTAPHSGCPGPCDVGVQTAPVGSTTWTRTVAPGALHPRNEVTGVQLARSAADAYLLFTANPAGGAPNATSTLFRSTDSGRTWRSVGEPCPQGSGENDSAAVTAGRNGTVALLCNRRLNSNRSELVTSADAGASFTRQPGFIPFQWPYLLAGDPNTVLVVASVGPVARSTDGGRSWHLITGLPGDPITFLGFESSRVGRMVADDSRSIWTTRDGGRTWTPVRFH